MIAGAMYDSNVHVTASATDTGEPASDTCFTIEPTGQLDYRGALTTFPRGYHGTLRRYFDLDAARRLRPAAATSRSERRATKRVTLFANDSYSHGPDDR